MATSQEYFLNKITNILGLSVEQLEVLSNEISKKIFTIIHWKYEKTQEWCTTKYKLTITRGEVPYGDRNIKCVQKLAWWDKKLTLGETHIELSEFNATMMADFIDEANFDYEDGKKDSDIDKPDNISHRKWLVWEDMGYTYLNNTKNS